MGFLSFSFFDLLDILLVTILLSQLYRLIKGSSAYFIFMGIFTIYLVWVVVKIFNMDLISSIIGQILGVGVIALIIVFQQEIRRFLLFIGNKYFTKSFAFTSNSVNVICIEEIVLACESMSESSTGALIVLEQTADLTFVCETGDQIDAVISRRLIENIFYKNSPLHDGAMVIKNNRIGYARCVLPTTDNPKIPAYYGMRHRAAIGVSEVCDAVVIVVSEQSGKISFIQGGSIVRGVSSLRLKELLMKVNDTDSTSTN